jgi:hypothetical protein
LFIVIAKRPDIGYCLLFTKNSILIHMVTWLVAEYRPGFKCSSLLLFEIFYEQLPCCVIVSLVPLHKPSPLLIFRNSIIGRPTFSPNMWSVVPGISSYSRTLLRTTDLHLLYLMLLCTLYQRFDMLCFHHLFYSLYKNLPLKKN